MSSPVELAQLPAVLSSLMVKFGTIPARAISLALVLPTLSRTHWKADLGSGHLSCKGSVAHSIFVQDLLGPMMILWCFNQKKMNEYSHKITYFHAPILVWVEPHAKIDQWNGALGVWLGATQDLIHTGIRNQVCHQRVLAIVRNCDPNEHSCDEDDALHLGDVLSAWRETIIKSRFKANFVVIGCCATKDYFWRACTIYCLQFPRTLTKSEVE